ncbi:MAG: thymidylate kinase [Sphingomonas bacterium]|uniref:thymidylate kinase n=1 Tax=Sphingomonas bacterium TaxID=1895847 RepID=UPI00261FDC39|nr:thymidylate kinase [Sphingomonas bacterium]MDB5695081.1 thymidylate kinase [Sphingomonas bacterium]
MLLAIEGGDGAGKATAAAEVVRQLIAAGRTATVMSFPRYAETTGGWALGEMLGGRLPREVSPRAAAVLYALDRMESRGSLLAAADAHEVVVLDRYIASNLAYQAARGAPEDADELMRWSWALETDTFALPRADLNVYLATPVDVARRQIAMKRQRSYTDATFDANEADTALQARVRDNYAAMARAGWAGRWVTVETVADGAIRAPDEIAREVIEALI